MYSCLQLPQVTTTKSHIDASETYLRSTKIIFNIQEILPLSDRYTQPNVIITDNNIGLHEQKAPLTLRGQRGRGENIEGEPLIFVSFLSSKARPLFLCVWFYGGSWQTTAACQYIVASFSHCRNIIGKPQNFGKLR